MLRYVPEFILEKYRRNVFQGSEPAYVIQADIVDFTPLCEEFRKAGKKGAEALSVYLREALSCPIRVVTSHGGFVSHFGGDSVYAVFPGHRVGVVKHVCEEIIGHYSNNGSIQTCLGTYPVQVRLTVSSGELEWRIFPGQVQSEYVFFGAPIRELLNLAGRQQALSLSNQVSTEFERVLPERFAITCDPGQSSDDAVEAFINRRFKGMIPENEIREGVYCFVDLSEVDLFRLDGVIDAIHVRLEEYGGFLNKLDSGDKGLIALILFGLPKALGHSLDRACRFALEIVSEIPELRIGMTCGSVYSGIVGCDDAAEYTVLGLSVNLAARLMQTARAGQILTDSFMAIDLGDRYCFKPGESLVLKGFAAQVRSHLLTERLAVVPHRYHGKLEGRASELGLISGFLLEPGRGILYVSGEPGIGKSRLIYAALAAEPGSFFLFCDPASHLYLEPVRQFLRQLFELDLLNTHERNQMLFRQKWQELAGSDLELQRLESILGALLDFEWQDSVWSLIPPKQRPEQQHKAFVSLVALLAGRRDVLIHLDDPQWLDPVSLDFFRSLGQLDKGRVKILAACRYNPDGSCVDLGIDRWKTSRLELTGLPGEATEKIIKDFLASETIPAASLDWMIRKSGGNPFFLEQVLGYLKENHCFDPEMNLVGNLDQISSFSISDIIGSRIDSLTQKVRETLLHASVLGLEFNTRILSEMLSRNLETDLGEGKLARIWRDLDELRYFFTHVLIRETAYNRMLSDKLKKLHLLAAEAMERLGEQSGMEVVAYHYECAGILDRARMYYLKAGLQYTRVFTFASADECLSKALAISQTLYGECSEQVAEILAGYEELCFNRGELTSSREACERVLDILSSTVGIVNDRFVIALMRLFKVSAELGDASRMPEILERAHSICLELYGDKDNDLSNSVLYNKGMYHFHRAEYQQALEILEQVVQTDARLDLSQTPIGVRHLSDQGVCVANMGDINTAEEIWTQAHASFVKLLGTDHPDATTVLMNLGIIARIKGNLSKALENHSQCMKAYERVYGKDHPDTVDAISHYANDLYFLSRFDECIPLLEQVVGIDRELNRLPRLASNLNDLGNMLIDSGNIQKGIDCYLESVSIKEQIWGPEHPSIALTYENIGETYYGEKDYESALIYYEKNMRIRKKTYETGHYSIGKSEFLIASALEKLFRYEEAEAHFRGSIRIYEESVGEDSVLIIPALINYGSFLTGRERYPEARSMMERAFDLVKATDAPLENEHYREVLKDLPELCTKCGDHDQAAVYQLLLTQTPESGFPT